jgi:NAD(P)-dependent dehydrogenase (short-subunit alcohol dehydrogenase family)
MNDLFSLEGRTALVTGGSRGIGRMIAAGFLRQGARVYISARKAEACDRTAAELAAFGSCVSLPADISTPEGIRALVEAYAKHEPTLDILVNNAGAAWGESFDPFPEKGWDKVVDLNLKTPFFLTQALIEPLRKAAAARRCAPYGSSPRRGS